MNETVYHILSNTQYIILIFDIFCIIYTIKTIIRKRENSIYMTKLLLYFGLFLVLVFFIGFFSYILQKQNQIYSPSTIRALIFFLCFGITGIPIIWIWNHWEIEVSDDKFVIHHFMIGKTIIMFSEIDINNSRYVFNLKEYIASEKCLLVLKDGRNIKFDCTTMTKDGNKSLLTDIIFFKLKIKRI